MSSLCLRSIFADRTEMSPFYELLYTSLVVSCVCVWEYTFLDEGCTLNPLVLQATFMSSCILTLWFSVLPRAPSSNEAKPLLVLSPYMSSSTLTWGLCFYNSPCLRYISACMEGNHSPFMSSCTLTWWCPVPPWALSAFAPSLPAWSGTSPRTLPAFSPPSPWKKLEIIC